MGKQRFNLVGSTKAKAVLAEYSDYRFFWRNGFAYRGASEHEDDKQIHNEYVWEERRKRDVTFEERMERNYRWAVAIDIVIDHDKKEIHMSGFSENDMW